VILADHQLCQALQDGTLAVDPLGPGAIQPASIDLRLGGAIKRLRPTVARLDARQAQDAAWVDEYYLAEEPIDLRPREFILGATLESIAVGVDLAAQLGGKSSLARMGIAVHVTAGFVDSGWGPAPLTLELVNVAPVPVRLYVGQYVAQLQVWQLAAPAEQPYRGHYRGAVGPQASRAHLQMAEV